LNKFDSRDKEELIDASNCKEISNKSSAKMTSSKEITEPLLTISQAARKNGVTRQAIFFAIRMNRLNAHRENDTWLITEKDLKEYVDNKYDRSRSRKKGKLIFDKSKGFYSISEAAKFLGKNNNHIYYLVRMGRLKTHRQGNAIVIQDLDLYMHAQFYQKRKNNNLKTG
jgi:hypothetical protein